MIHKYKYWLIRLQPRWKRTPMATPGKMKDSPWDKEKPMFLRRQAG